MSHECSMCEQKKNTEQIVNHDKIIVWYCHSCQMLDVETNTTIATLFQGVL